jgi:hypothetical protein
MQQITYRDWMIQLSKFAERTDSNPLNRLAYKLVEGEFRGIEFTTPAELLRELSLVIMLSESMRESIIKSALQYINFTHGVSE